MSAPAPASTGWLNAAAKAAALAGIAAVYAWAKAAAPDAVALAEPLAAVGLLLLAGDLLAELLERFHLPHLTGYLAAGVVLGPHVLGMVSASAVEGLSLVNALALALIALSAGGELSLGLLRAGARSLAWATLGQLLVALPLAAAGFLLLRTWLPLPEGMGLTAALGVALLWGVLAVSRSPAATLGLIAQVRPEGPLTRYALALVVAFDVVVLLLFSVALEVTRALTVPGAALDLDGLRESGVGVVGAIAAGTTLGLLVAAYLKLVGRQLLLVLVVLAYGVTAFCSYFHFDSLLLFVVAGFVTANLSKGGGEQLLDAVSQGGRVTYVLFFAVAGAHLDLPLLARIWPVALGLAAIRVAATWLAARASSRLAGDEAVVRRYGWMPLVSQAGVTLGMAVIVGQTFADSFGPSLQSLAVAVVGLNEAVGPILFKLALDRSGETGRAAPPAEPASAEELPERTAA